MSVKPFTQITLAAILLLAISSFSPAWAQTDVPTPSDAPVADAAAETAETTDLAKTQGSALPADDEQTWSEAVDAAFGSYLVVPVATVLFYDFGTGVPFVVVWLFCGAVFLTLRMGFINFRAFRHAIDLTRGVYDTPDEPGEITHFQALAAALSATVGLGNIAGVAIAIATGGPGATVWIILVGLLGMTAKFAECTLGQLYRVTDEDGAVIGGPMRYLKSGLKDIGLAPLGNVLAVFFMIICVGASFGGGNAFQVGQSLEAIRGDLPLLETMPWLYGVTMAIAVGVVIIGGIKSIGAVAGRIVPLMCLAYVTTAIYILIRNYDAVPSAAATIVQQAFTPDAAYGGFIGVLVIGIKRAVFSNEAGVGSAAIAHSAAKTDEPVSEGIVALLEPFIDTVVVCTITALVVVVTGAYLAPKTDFNAVDFSSGTTELTEQSSAGLSDIADVLKNNSHTNITLEPLSKTELAQKQSSTIRDFLIAADIETNRIVINEFDSESSAKSLPDKTGLSVDVAKSQGARLTLYAFVSGGHDWFRYILYFAVVLFAYSTCISWSYYGERCWVELFGAKTSMIYKILFLLFTVLGSIVTRGNILDFSDLMILGMSFPNLLGVFLLSGIVKRQLDLYWQKYKNNELARADGVNLNADSSEN